MTSLCFAQLTGPLPGITADMDYFCYYGSFGPTEVWQAQYFDLFILEPNQISAEQVEDIRNGFDDVLGTDDDVLVFGYVSVGETYHNEEVGDGTGPVYFNGTDTIYQNSGYASYFLDDYDQDGEPDMNGTWSSYYVNAGDPVWWEFNAARLDNTLLEKHCDGLFLDTIGMPVPASWGGSYGWTAGGMAEYVAFLRTSYPDKYLFANNPSLYLHPALPAYPYKDLIRSSINAYMYEGYYLGWDWDLSEGIMSPWFEGARDTWAPIINTEGAKVDGFITVALDYVSVDQSDYETLLANEIQYTEVDQNWLTAVSSVWLNEIRYDTYHNHPVDNNSPTWPGLPGILYHALDSSEVTLYWDAAVDQTGPVTYQLYFENDSPNLSDDSGFMMVNPTASDVLDWEYTISNVTMDTQYYAVLRATDSATDAHTDGNTRIVEISTSLNTPTNMATDGFFEDWSDIEVLDGLDEVPELTGDAPVPACDLEDIWVAVDKNTLYFSTSYAVAPALGTYFYHMFLDTDDNPTTGFHYGESNLGADYMVENYSLFRYTGVDGSWGWEFVNNVNLETGNIETNRFEANLPLGLLDMQGFTLQFIFNVNDNVDLGPDDFAPDNYTTHSYEVELVTQSLDDVVLPRETMLSAFPNPFNNSISFRLDSYTGSAEKGQLFIYDIRGKLIQKIEFSLTQDAQIIWSGNDVKHHSIASGVYIYRLTTSNQEKGQILSSGKILAIK